MNIWIIVDSHGSSPTMFDDLPLTHGFLYDSWIGIYSWDDPNELHHHEPIVSPWRWRIIMISLFGDFRGHKVRYLYLIIELMLLFWVVATWVNTWVHMEGAMKTAEHVRPLIGLRWFTTVLYWIRGEYIYIYICSCKFWRSSTQKYDCGGQNPNQILTRFLDDFQLMLWHGAVLSSCFAGENNNMEPQDSHSTTCIQQSSQWPFLQRSKHKKHFKIT